MSENENVDARTPDAPVDLQDVGEQLLREAATGDNGRAALTLTPGEGGPLKQTLLALRADHELSEHTSPGPASVHVLRGRAVLVSDGRETPLPSGQWTALPLERHAVRAVEDTIALLTVVPNP